jgi:hypothetical protein
MLIETVNPGEHNLTLRNGAQLTIKEGLDNGHVTITNCRPYVNQMAVTGMGHYEVALILTPKEPKNGS